MNQNTEPIDIILITGFLGAGKSTLVNRLLAGGLGQGAGLLVNDFGDVVVDGSLIKGRMEIRDQDAENMSHSAETGTAEEGIEVFEVAGGSIFCSCKTANFALGLRMFTRIRPSRLIVEASGMSDPSGLDKLLAEYRMAADYRLARVVCLADAVRTPKMMGNLPALRRQIETADLILLNKCDLVDEENKASFEKALLEINPDVEIQRTVRADIDPERLRGKASGHRRGEIVSCDTPESRPGTLQLEASNLPKDVLDAFLHDQLPNTWRIKGWVKADSQWWFVSDNAGRLEWTESPLPPGMVPGITVITPPGRDQVVADAWRGFLGSPT